jgi:curved DNA-binding protein CbpA
VQEYTDAISFAQAAFKEDKRFRASLLSNRAACHRRRGAEGLAEALADCDAALCLLPKMARCLYRRSVILLELGRPDEAITALETLYRIDRAWPKLSEHLIRAHAAKRRNDTAKKYEEANTSEADDEDDEVVSDSSGSSGSSDYYNSDEDDAAYIRRREARQARRLVREDARQKKKEAKEKARAAAQAEKQRQRMSDPSEAERIAKEQDHYVVLGVNADATAKQLKTAYRMMSLKYHPDRPKGSTAAFQRIAGAYQTLSDPVKRRDYDDGTDIKSRRGGKDSDSDGYASDEENKQTLREEIERKYFPERYEFWPFGDPFIQKRKRAEKLRKKQGKKAWHEDSF